MKVLAVHDHRGELTAMIIGPRDESAPVGNLAVAGSLVTAVDAPDLPEDLDGGGGEARLIEILAQHRIEPTPAARLVPRDGSGRRA